MKQIPRFFGGLPAMPSPSSSTGSGRYFSRNAETFLGSEGVVFQEKYSTLRFIMWCVECVYHPRIDACYVHKDIKHSKRPSPYDTRDGIRSTHLVTRVHATLCHIIVQDNLWFFSRLIHNSRIMHT